MGMQPLFINAQQQSELMLTQAPSCRKTEGFPEESCKNEGETHSETSFHASTESKHASEGATALPNCGSQKGCPTLHGLVKFESPLVLSLHLPHPLLQRQRCQESCMVQGHNLRRMREFRPTPQCSVGKAKIGQTLWPILAQQRCERQKAKVEAAD